MRGSEGRDEEIYRRVIVLWLDCPPHPHAHRERGGHNLRRRKGQNVSAEGTVLTNACCTHVDACIHVHIGSKICVSSSS